MPATNQAVYAVIDTEGSGTFDFTQDADADGQPRLAQLALLRCDADFNVLSSYAGYVRPDGWTMDPAATAVNGLTDEFLNEHGKPVTEVLSEYQNAIEEGLIVVAFNAQHDCKQLRGELRRAEMDDMFERTRNICVMRGSAGCGMRPDGKKGWPKLEHVRAFLGLNTEGAHKADRDAEDARRCAQHLKSIDRLPEAAVHYAKNRSEEA